ncbi:hypothetical protein [Candidatus Microthrix parvicella]|uniref:Uncharacterized protein n=1 Tax=Candidatus Neomicrothrix parvicella RN1 TaxID=1229780 RepID=R4Z190_9ACTN|nr:hypothetical protein [Candidatus Microthrix parvicella]CCM64430.1 hypothetical protein BN381_40044 [Candidatus Microthrix parvicella RN1]
MTNTFLPILLAKAALGALTQGGVIVNIPGVIAEQNLPGMAAAHRDRIGGPSHRRSDTQDVERAGSGGRRKR